MNKQMLDEHKSTVEKSFNALCDPEPKGTGTGTENKERLVNRIS